MYPNKNHNKVTMRYEPKTDSSYPLGYSFLDIKKEGEILGEAGDKVVDKYDKNVDIGVYLNHNVGSGGSLHFKVTVSGFTPSNLEKALDDFFDIVGEPVSVDEVGHNMIVREVLKKRSKCLGKRGIMAIFDSSYPVLDLDTS